jgi:transcriptional regulator
MLTQEEYMYVLKLRHEGYTITEIAEELGYAAIRRAWFSWASS